jgi:hypothetical protein
VFVQKRAMRPQNDSSKKVEANQATKAASNSHGNDVEGVLKGPKVRCTGLPIKSFVRKTREVLSNTGPESLPPWESANGRGFTDDHFPD